MIKTLYGSPRLRGTLQMPSDKSISHRSAMFAALAEGESMIDNYSRAADPQSTLNCLRGLGVPVSQEGSRVVIRSEGRQAFQVPESDLDCGNSGTTMRLLSGILAGAGIRSRLIGDQSLSSRTMKRIIEPLTSMGAVIRARESEYAPLEIEPGNGISGIRYPLPIASAQLKSAVLLAGLYSEQPVEVIETAQSRDHTERLLDLPVVQNEEGKVIVSSLAHNVPLQCYTVPGDFSAAAFWLVAGAVHPDAELRLERVGLNPSRIAALNILLEMGADIEIVSSAEEEGPEPMATVIVRSSELSAIRLDPKLVPNCIDELPVLMVAMCFAKGRSEITDAEELRHKETDRLSAMAAVLENAGESFEETAGGIVIQGRGVHKPLSGSFQSEHDHRIAMSSAVLALMGREKSTVADSECTAISYPGFWDDLDKVSRQ
ncbi:MAG: 3-phosphoshikimate 1-carboxyvinyltransferase [Balneolaceae bacterium]